MKRVLATLILSMCVSACGGSSPSSTAPTTIAATRIINVSGNLAFGNVNLGSTADLTCTITNSGNAPLTIDSMGAAGGTGSAGFTGTLVSHTINAGSTQTSTLHFAPTVAQFYSNVMTFIGDQTSGGNAINVSGTGTTATPTPSTTFSLNGTVTDGTSHGILPNITVQIVSGMNVGKSDVTDSGGNYSMSALSAGTCTLSAAATSYQTTTQEVTLSTGTRVDLVLQRMSAPTPTPPPTSRTRIGATCKDGWISSATGSGACSSHGGVLCWRYNDGTCTNP